MRNHQSLDTLSRRSKIFWGCAAILVGLALAFLMVTQPERLRVPLWVGLLAALSFVVTGATITAHSFVSRSAYAWCIAVLCLLMACVPIWIAVFPGDRHCTINLPVIAGQALCRWVFAIGSLVPLLLASMAARSALKTRER